MPAPALVAPAPVFVVPRLLVVAPRPAVVPPRPAFAAATPVFAARLVFAAPPGGQGSANASVSPGVSTSPVATSRYCFPSAR